MQIRRVAIGLLIPVVIGLIEIMYWSDFSSCYTLFGTVCNCKTGYQYGFSVWNEASFLSFSKNGSVGSQPSWSGIQKMGGYFGSLLKNHRMNGYERSNIVHSLIVHQAYPILLHSVDEHEFPIPVFQYNPHWYEDYTKKLQDVVNHYDWSRPSSFESYLQSQNDSYSSFVRSKNTEGGYTFAYGKNICYNTKRHQYVFLFEQNRFHLNPTGSNAFLYGWKWYNTRNTAQTINAYWVEEDSYITQPYTIHHIYHFVESINFLWTKLMFPGDYPVMKQLWLPRLNTKTDYPWAVDFIHVMKKAFSDFGLEVVNKTGIDAITAETKKHIICFRRVLLLDRTHYNGDGGSISGWEPADWLRANFYKFANVQPKVNQRGDVYQMHLVQRTGPRHILRGNEIIRGINKRFNGIVNATLMFSNCSLADQIHMFADADIIMTPHGAGQTNIIFMRPRTVFMETFPPYFYECTFMNLANIVRVHYISITTYNETYLDPHAKKGSADAYYQRGIFILKRKHYIRTVIDPNHFTVFSAVDDAVEYLNTYRYGRAEFRDNFLF